MKNCRNTGKGFLIQLSFEAVLEIVYLLEVWLSGLKRHPAKVLVPVRGPEGSNPSASAYFGGVPEWSNGAVSKTVDPGNRVRGFESHSLRRK